MWVQEIYLIFLYYDLGAGNLFVFGELEWLMKKREKIRPKESKF